MPRELSCGAGGLCTGAGVRGWLLAWPADEGEQGMVVAGRAAGHGHGCKWEKKGRAFCRARGCSCEVEGRGWPRPVLGQAWFGLVRLLMGHWPGLEGLGLGLLGGSKVEKAQWALLGSNGPRVQQKYQK